jgi:TonB family protein
MNLPGSSEAALAFLVACFAKTTVLLTLAWIVALALRDRSAALRHQAWAAGILGSLALPVLTLLLPAWHSATLGSAAALWSPAHALATSAGSQNLPPMIVDARGTAPLLGKLPILILGAWFLGFFVLALRLAGGFMRLTRASALARPVLRNDWLLCASELSSSLKIARPVRLLQSDNPLVMPVTFGIFSPLIVLPAGASEWPENRRRMVLLHELAHVSRHDWFLQLCAELARSFYWFHPLAWLASASLRHESERACDDAVLNSGIEASEYAHQLLDLARTLQNPDRSWSAALAIARPSHFERRLIAMLNSSTDRKKISRKTGLLTSVATLCLLIPLAALRLPAQNLSDSFGGTIRDASGTGVRNATVIMINHKSNTVVMTASDNDGKFSLKSLLPGEYELKVVKRGFETYRVPQVVLEAGRESSQDVTLEVAAVMEEVEVVPQGTTRPLPETENGGKPSRLRLGGDVEATKIVHKVMPVYPDAAKAAGIQGTVILHAVISMGGTPLSLRIMNNQVDPALARSAVEAVSQWRYRPTLLNGEPIEVDTTIMVNFSLAP